MDGPATETARKRLVDRSWRADVPYNSGVSGKVDRPSEAPMLQCLCANLRRAARLVSVVYESEPGWPNDLSVGQNTLLRIIARSGTMTHADVGWRLGLDQTTVSRSLAILKRRRLILVAPGPNRRERLVSLSKEGKRELQRLKPAWRRAQARLRRRYGAERWSKLMRALTLLASVTSVPPGHDGPR